MNAPPPLISVILCTRDRPESFQRALASVYAQDAEPFEVVVIDGSRPAVDVCAPAQIPTRVITGEWHGEGRARAAGLRQLPATSSPGATTTRSGPQGICAGCAMH
jgi:glycosyltransferase involved in cell wall biosynthesis